MFLTLSPVSVFKLIAASDARAVVLHNNLLCNDTCSVIGGCITYWEAQTDKILYFLKRVVYRQHGNGELSNQSERVNSEQCVKNPC